MMELDGKIRVQKALHHDDVITLYTFRINGLFMGSINTLTNDDKRKAATLCSPITYLDICCQCGVSSVLLSFCLYVKTCMTFLTSSILCWIGHSLFCYILTYVPYSKSRILLTFVELVWIWISNGFKFIYISYDIYCFMVLSPVYICVVACVCVCMCLFM